MGWSQRNRVTLPRKPTQNESATLPDKQFVSIGRGLFFFSNQLEHGEPSSPFEIHALRSMVDHTSRGSTEHGITCVRASPRGICQHLPTRLIIPTPPNHRSDAPH